MLNYFSKTFSELATTARRFPISVFCCLIYYFLWDELDFSDRKQPIENILVLSFFWFGAAKLYGEAKGFGWLKSYTQAFLSFGVISLIYYFNYNSQTFTLLLFSSLLFVVVAPFLGGKTRDMHFYNYNRDVWMGFLYSVLLSIVFALGVLLIFATIKQLFDARLNDISEALIRFCFICIAPIFVLSFVPKNFSEDKETQIPRGLKFILSYIIVPLGLAYLLVLYAYVLKIIYMWELPQGGLALYVALFGAAGSVIHLACYPIRETGNFLTRIFSKYFCFALIPLVLVLFVAVGFRIEEYGVTSSRYILVLAGIWFMITAVNYLRKRDDFSMKFGAELLLAAFLLASFGPWGAISISGYSQLNRLEQLLTENDLLKDGKIVKAEGEIDKDVNYEISSVIEYLEKTDKIELAYEWIDGDIGENHFDAPLYTAMGVPEKHRARHYGHDKRFHLREPYNPTNYHRIEKGIYITSSMSFYCGYKCENKRLYLFEEDGQEAQFAMEYGVLKIVINEKKFADIDLQDLKANAESGDFTHRVENGIGLVSIAVERISGLKQDDGSVVDEISFKAVVRIK